jgi:guanine deaminase
VTFIDDADYLRRAIELATQSVRRNRGGPFGAVVVKDGVIVGEGVNVVTSTNDPTAHAEVMAIRAAGAHLATFSLRGARIYASSEPCPMCLAAIYWSRLDGVVFATACDVAARVGFDDTFLYEQLALSAPDRSLPMRQLSLPEGVALFDEWRGKPDKTPY